MAGEKPDFEAICGEYRDSIARYVFHILGGRPQDYQDAEDITSEVFMKAWMAYDSVVDNSNIRGWLHRIARNLTIDVMRKWKRSRFLNVSLDVYITEASPGMEEEYEKKEFVAMIFKRMSNYRHETVLRCHYAEGDLPEEIADKLGIKLSAFKMLLSRARSDFRATLALLRSEEQDT